MDALFSQLVILGSSLTLICALMLLWHRNVYAYTTAFAWQSVVLTGIMAVVAYFERHAEMYFVAALFLLLKGWVIPRLLRRIEQPLGDEQELRPYVNTATSLLACALLVLFAYVVSRPLVALSRLPTRAGMPLALGLIFISLFVIASRKKALTQVIGFLMLENGIALLAVLGTYGIPLVVELGVFLDLLLGVIVMQLVIYHIRDTFESIDVEQLGRLRH
jgi:hydrogenase-4 component E